MDFGLTKKETALFDLLLSHKVVTRELVLTEIHGVPADLVSKIQTRSADMAVARLRRKLPFTIETVRGIGYRLLIG